MVNVLRRWSQPIMVIITVLVIVSFLYFGPGMRGSNAGKQIVVNLYGNDITVEDMTRQSRRVGIFAALRGEYIASLDRSIMFTGRDPDVSTVARSFVMEHEMDQLGLTATDEEKIAALEEMPIFQDQGKFDPDRFNRFKTNVLNPNGFSEGDFFQIFLNGEVRARKLQEVVGSVASASKKDARDLVIKQKQKTEASYVAFRRADFRKDIKATDEELKKRYEEQKDLFKTPEARKVRFAAFLLPSTPDNKPLEEKERTKKLQDLANAAYAFHEEVAAAKDKFAELAKKHNATIGETKEFFTATTVPNELEGSDELGEKAFELTKEAPISNHITLQKGTYVLELLEIKQPEQRKFEDVRKELEEQVISAKADELAQAKATEIRPKLAEAIKGGKSFADAAKELGLTVEQAPTFGGGQRSAPGQFDSVISPAAAKLAPGEISEVLTAPSNDVKLIAHLDYRSAVEEKDIETALPQAIQRNEMMTRYMLFQNWMAERGRAAGLDRMFSKESGS